MRDAMGDKQEGEHEPHTCFKRIANASALASLIEARTKGFDHGTSVTDREGCRKSRTGEQDFTQADVTKLRAAGYSAPMLDVAEGVTRYVESLISASAPDS